MTAAVDADLFAWGADLDDLVGPRVTQCALSRICGACGKPLARPVAFLGTPQEQGRNAFHNPPLHAECAEQVRVRTDADPDWVLVLTSGFEFVRPGREGRRPAAELPAELADLTGRPGQADEPEQASDGVLEPGHQCTDVVPVVVGVGPPPPEGQAQEADRARRGVGAHDHVVVARSTVDRATEVGSEHRGTRV